MVEGVAAFAVGCLLGWIPGAVIAGRAVGVDVRGAGSGNPGASNLARLSGLLPATAAFAIDAGKTVAAVLAVDAWGAWAQAAAGAGVVVGHAWPPWLRFRGGRGLGEILVAGLLVAPAGAGVLIAFLTGGVVTRRLGLAAGLGLLAFPIAACLWDDPSGVAFAIFALVASAARRAQGSPHVSGARLGEAWKDRLIYDREPETPPGHGASGPL